MKLTPRQYRELGYVDQARNSWFQSKTGNAFHSETPAVGLFMNVAMTFLTVILALAVVIGIATYKTIPPFSFVSLLIAVAATTYSWAAYYEWYLRNLDREFEI